MVLVPLVLISLLAGAVVTGIVLHWPSADPGSPRIARHAARKIERSLQEHRGFRQFLARRTNPKVATGLMLTVALAIMLLGGFAFGVLAVLVHTDTTIVSIDRSFSQWASDNSPALATDILEALTEFGGTALVLVAVVVVIVVEHIRLPSRWIAPFLVVVVLGQSLVTNGIKELFDRVRPDLNPEAHLLGPSFPSGHTATAAATWAAVALLMGRGRGRRAHAALAGGAAALGVAVACTRVLLGVHWFSDVLAGLALGWAWFALCSVAFGGRLLRLGAPVEIAERALNLPVEPSVPPGAAHAARAPVGVEDPRMEEVQDRPHQG